MLKVCKTVYFIDKIDKQHWAKEIYTDCINRIHPEVEKYNLNPDEYLKGMPFDWDKQKSEKIPPFILTRHMVNGEYRNLDNATSEEWAPASALIQYLQTGLDCGIAYYLTGDELKVGEFTIRPKESKKAVFREFQN